MPGRVVSVDDSTEYVYGSISDPVPLLVSGNRNQVYVYSPILTATGSGPAITLTGTGNRLYLYSLAVNTGGTTAIQGSAGRDEIINASAAIGGRIDLAGGDDYFSTTGSYGVGPVLGGAGNDTLVAYTATVSVNFSGDDGNDGLAGGSAADQLDGGSGDDFLYGNAGNDTLTGGSGADRLEGGTGNDTISGGGDEGDMVVFNNYRADTSVNLVNGLGTLVDNGGSFDDQGTDTVSGVYVVRFRDQQVDFRIAESTLVLNQAGQSYTNSTARYGFAAADIRADGVTLTNTATIRGTGVAHSVEVSPGVFGEGMDAALVVNAANVTIANQAGGSIVGIARAIGVTYPPPAGGSFPGQNLVIDNAGSIRSLESSAIYSTAAGMAVTNAVGGVIEGAYFGIATPNGSSSIVNAGLIRGGAENPSYLAIVLSSGQITNTGRIEGGFSLGSYSGTVNNSGTITGNSRGYAGLTLHNTAGGIITGNLTIDVGGTVGQGNPSFTYFTFDNRAQFTGDVIIAGTARSYVVDPATGSVYTASIANTGTLTGSIVSNPVLGTGPGGALQVSLVDRVTNSGTITGDIRLGGGDDYVLNNGTVGGTIAGEDGNDTLIGGAGNDRLDGGTGVNTLYGGAGDDRLIVGAGGNGTIVDGGADGDTLVVIGAVTLGGLAGIEAIDLQSGGALTLSGAQFNAGLAPSATLSGTGALTINMGAGDGELYLQQLLGGSDVTITVNGSATGMLVKGAVNAVNVTNGGDGSDSIRGSTRADTLSGGNGNDKIEGGMGADILTGGTGADTFRYQSASASGLGVNADRITDFVSGTDKLGFLLLDANPGTPAIDPFGYIDTQAFHATGAGEIRYETTGADLTVQVDVNGDGIADMAIILLGLGGGSLASGDFLI